MPSMGTYGGHPVRDRFKPSFVIFDIRALIVTRKLCYSKDDRAIKKKLKPDKFFMGKPSQNYGVPPK